MHVSSPHGISPSPCARYWSLEADHRSDADRAKAQPATVAGGSIAVAGAAVIVTIAASTSGRRESPAMIARSSLPPSEVELCSDCVIAVSPDGRSFVFVARQRATTPRHLWVQSLGDVSARPIEGTEGARFPFWSPDSQSLAFFAGNTLSRIGLAGGSPQQLCSPCAGQGTWGESGIFVFGGAGNPLRGISASGGEPFQVTEWDPLRPKVATCIQSFFRAGGACCFDRGIDHRTGGNLHGLSRFEGDRISDSRVGHPHALLQDFCRGGTPAVRAGGHVDGCAL